MAFDLSMKFVVIGMNGVGKASLVYRFAEGRFPYNGYYSIGLDFYKRIVTIGGARIKLNIYNLGAAEIWPMPPSVVAGALAILLVYDITDRVSLRGLVDKLNEARQYSSPDVVVILVGNKSDLNCRQVTRKDGEAFAREHGFDGFTETSAIRNHNVDDVFIEAAQKIYDKIKSGIVNISDKSHGILVVPTYKFIIIGAQSVGKTALMLQFTEKIFRLEHISTIPVSIGSRNIPIGQVIKLQIFDTVGQERFKSITRSYYRDVAAALLVYDVTDRETFKRLPWWLKEVRNHTSRYIAITLVGNKIDLIEERQVRNSEGEAFARDNGLEFMEVSAKTGTKVEKVFQQTAEEVYEKIQAKLLQVNTDPNGIKLGSNGSDSKNSRAETDKFGCC